MFPLLLRQSLVSSQTLVSCETEFGFIPKQMEEMSGLSWPLILVTLCHRRNVRLVIGGLLVFPTRCFGLKKYILSLDVFNELKPPRLEEFQNHF